MSEGLYTEICQSNFDHMPVLTLEKKYYQEINNGTIRCEECLVNTWIPADVDSIVAAIKELYMMYSAKEELLKPTVTSIENTYKLSMPVKSVNEMLNKESYIIDWNSGKDYFNLVLTMPDKFTTMNFDVKLDELIEMLNNLPPEEPEEPVDPPTDPDIPDGGDGNTEEPTDPPIDPDNPDGGDGNTEEPTDPPTDPDNPDGGDGGTTGPEEPEEPDPGPGNVTDPDNPEEPEEPVEPEPEPTIYDIFFDSLKINDRVSYFLSSLLMDKCVQLTDEQIAAIRESKDKGQFTSSSFVPPTCLVPPVCCDMYCRQCNSALGGKYYIYSHNSAPTVLCEQCMYTTVERIAATYNIRSLLGIDPATGLPIPVHIYDGKTDRERVIDNYMSWMSQYNIKHNIIKVKTSVSG